MFFKNNKNYNNDLIKIAALLIHAAKIDENFTIEEEKIIEETLLNLGANKENVKQIIMESKKIEEKANQILEFTKEVKNITLQPIKRYDLDAAIIFSDILMVPFGLGQNVEFKKNLGPNLGSLEITELQKITENSFKIPKS